MTKYKLHESFEYVDGKLLWKNHLYVTKIGQEAGYVKENGYRRVSHYGKHYYTHRLIWFLHYKKWPLFIDHIDGNRTNNKIENLRSVTQQENNSNRIIHRGGKLAGAFLRKKDNVWVASAGICKNGKRKTTYIGYFKTELDAHKAYVEYCKSKKG